MKVNNLTAGLFIIIGAFAFSTDTKASVIITVDEVSDDVVFSYSGSLDTTGLIATTITNGFGLYGGDIEGKTAIAFGVGDSMQRYSQASFPVSSTSDSILFGSTTGSGFALFADDVLGLPFDYVSDNFISGTLTLENQTFETLGLIGGTYKSVLPSNDFIQMEIDSVVPIPAAAWLFVSGLIGIVGLARRKK